MDFFGNLLDFVPVNDETIEVPVDQETIIRGIEQNENNIWGLLVGTGYLKVVQKPENASSLMCKVKIPNFEIKLLIESSL